MAKSMSGHRPAGGIASRQVVKKPVKTGVGNRGVSVGAVGQLGHKQGSHTTEGKETSYRGAGPIHQGPALRPAEMGNALAAKTVCGPGGSRTIYASGSQGQTGSGGAEKPSGRDILGSFGPESSRGR
jgi:hypothetical protein